MTPGTIINMRGPNCKIARISKQTITQIFIKCFLYLTSKSCRITFIKHSVQMTKAKTQVSFKFKSLFPVKLNKMQSDNKVCHSRVSTVSQKKKTERHLADLFG